ncbi:MAG TPA: response regulator transcription factor [Candidatus Acidoferrum sp.]
MRILVADDHEVSRKGICSILSSRAGMDVCAEASDGQEAIEKALVVKPDMVILDFSMPTLDGVSAARTLKQILPTVPVIILSMHKGPQIVQAAQLAGARGFVSKSDAGAALLNAVDVILQGKNFFP